MADAVLGVGIHLGEAPVVAIGAEDRVVAEACGALACREDFAFDFSFEEVFFVAEDEGDDGAEARPAVGVPLHFGEDFAHVGFGVLGFACIAGGIDSGASAEGVDFKPGVVGKAVVAVVLLDVASLLEGIAFEGILFLGDVFVAADFGKGDDLVTAPEHAADFFQLVGVVCCKYDFHGVFLCCAAKLAHFSLFCMVWMKKAVYLPTDNENRRQYGNR